jgi:hypothetical protein
VYHTENLVISKKMNKNEKPGSHLVQTPFPSSLLEAATLGQAERRTTWKTTMALHGFKRSPCQAPCRGESASNSHLLGSRVEHANKEVTYWSDDQRNVALMALKQVPRNGPLLTQIPFAILSFSMEEKHA